MDQSPVSEQLLVPEAFAQALRVYGCQIEIL